MKGLLGVVHYALFPASTTGLDDITDTFRFILNDGLFGAIEVTWIRDTQIKRKAARILGSSGLQIMFSAGPPLLSSGLSLCNTDHEGRRRAVDFAKSLVDMAYELGACNLLVTSGPDPGQSLREAAITACRDSLDEICAYAIAQHPGAPIVVCLEPFDREVHFRQLLGPTWLAAAVVGDLRKRFGNCGITLDMSHVAQLGEKIEDAAKIAGEYLVHAHIANCVLDRKSPLYGDMHPPFDVPNGEYRFSDMERYLRALDSSGYFARTCPYGKPVVSVEVKPLAGQDPLSVLRDCKMYLTN